LLWLSAPSAWLLEARARLPEERAFLARELLEGDDEDRLFFDLEAAAWAPEKWPSLPEAWAYTKVGSFCGKNHHSLFLYY
jgi:hypothetical protein